MPYKYITDHIKITYTILIIMLVLTGLFIIPTILSTTGTLNKNPSILPAPTTTPTPAPTPTSSSIICMADKTLVFNNLFSIYNNLSYRLVNILYNASLLEFTNIKQINLEYVIDSQLEQLLDLLYLIIPSINSTWVQNNKDNTDALTYIAITLYNINDLSSNNYDNINFYNVIYTLNDRISYILNNMTLFYTQQRYLLFISSEMISNIIDIIDIIITQWNIKEIIYPEQYSTNNIYGIEDISTYTNKLNNIMNTITAIYSNGTTYNSYISRDIINNLALSGNQQANASVIMKEIFAQLIVVLNTNLSQINNFNKFKLQLVHILYQLPLFNETINIDYDDEATIMAYKANDMNQLLVLLIENFIFLIQPSYNTFYINENNNNTKTPPIVFNTRYPVNNIIAYSVFSNLVTSNPILYNNVSNSLINIINTIIFIFKNNQSIITQGTNILIFNIINIIEDYLITQYENYPLSPTSYTIPPITIPAPTLPPPQNIPDNCYTNWDPIYCD